MVDDQDKYMMMYRSEHPLFGIDPDLPGGIVEDGETMLDAMLREVAEETGIHIDPHRAEEVYSGTAYSAHGTHYSLFIARLDNRPKITISWEHESHIWLDRYEFIKRARAATDTFMHMVADIIESRE